MPRLRARGPRPPSRTRPIRRLLPAIFVAFVVSTACTPAFMLKYHRDRNPNGPYKVTECASPAETPSGRWDCPGPRVDQLRREARQLLARARRMLASPEAQVRMAAREFGIPEAEFVRVIECESGMNPRAVNASSGALGLGQHLPSYWGQRAAALGYSYDHWSDARANARVSAWLWATSGPQHWVCY